MTWSWVNWIFVFFITLHTQAEPTVKICPSSVSGCFIQPCPSLLRFIIIPFFQSFNLKICSSSFFNNTQAVEACPWEIMWPSLASRLDYIRGSGFILEEAPLFQYTISLELPIVLIFLALSQRMILMNMIWMRGRRKRIRWKDYNFQWPEIIRNNKS